MTEPPRIVKEGFLKKRKAKLHQWSQRYFVLTEKTLSYKIKQDTNEFKDSYDLVPGCIVTHIETESRASLKGRRLFSFWVVWPHDKKAKDDAEQKHPDSDDEKDAKEKEAEESSRVKNLKSIVESEVWEHRKQKNIVEEQIEMHHQRDHNISLGAKVAAVTVGGVIVGALTAGIGLLPYIAVVGVATVAGGGAVVYNWRKPFDSRLILACDTMEEAVEWRSAIEAQISRLESATRRLNLPSSLDPRVIGGIIGRAQQQRLWRRVAAPEGMRILELLLPRSYSEAERRRRRLMLLQQTDFEHRTIPPLLTPNCDRIVSDPLDAPCAVDDVDHTRCRRAQIAVPTTPLQTFLSLMGEGGLGREAGLSVRTLQQLDDHADALEVEIDFGLILGRKPRVHMRKLYFSRFWSLDDDGVYLVTLCASGAPLSLPNHSAAAGSAATVDYHPVKLDAKKRVYERCGAPTVHAVVTVAPRADFAEFSFDVHDCIVSCSVQLLAGDKQSGGWTEEEQSAFMDAFLRCQLLELRDSLCQERFTPLHQQSGAGPALVLAPAAHSTSWSASDELLAYGTEAAAAKCPPTPPPSSPVMRRAVTLSSSTISAPAAAVQTAVAASSGAAAASAPPSRSRRGVTTVQPGMEDVPGLAPPPAAAPVAVPVSHASPQPPQAPLAHHTVAVEEAAWTPASPSQLVDYSMPQKQSRTRRVLGLFSRHKSAPVEQLPLAQVGSADRAGSPPSSFREPSASAKTLTREERRQREKDFNRRAKKLRVKIEEKVCELKRVAETMRTASRQGMLLGADKDKDKDPAAAGSITPAQFALLQDQQGELVAELQRLKGDYLGFTGQPYDDKTAPSRSRFARWGRGKAPPPPPPPPPTSSVSAPSLAPPGRKAMPSSPSQSQVIDLSDEELLHVPFAAPSQFPAPERASRQSSRCVALTRLPPSFWSQPSQAADLRRAAAWRNRVSAGVALLSRRRFWATAWAQLVDDLCDADFDVGPASQRTLHLRNVCRPGPADMSSAVARDTLALAKAVLVLALVVVGLVLVQLLQPLRVRLLGGLVSLIV